MPGIVLNTFIHIILLNPLNNHVSYYYYPFLPVEDVEA